MKVKLTINIILLLVCLSGLAAQDRVGADVLYRAGKYQEAIDVCLVELEETEKNMNAYCFLVWSLLSLKRYPEALDYANAGRKISRYDRRMILAAGEALYYMGQNQEMPRK